MKKIFLFIQETFLKGIYCIWPKNKEYKKSLLKSIDCISSENSERQRSWCENAINEISIDERLSKNEIKLYIESIIKKLRHISFSFDFDLPGEDNKIEKKKFAFTCVFNTLLKKKNIESLGFKLDEESIGNKDEFVNILLKIINNNIGLRDISQLSLGYNSIDVEHLDLLMPVLLGKKINIFSLQWNCSRGAEGARILAKYLKKMDVSFLAINSINIGNEGALHLVKNLPENVEMLELNGNNINKDGADIIFDGLKNKKVRYISLCGNELSDYKPDHLCTISKFLAIRRVRLIDVISNKNQDDFRGIKNKDGREIQFVF